MEDTTPLPIATGALAATRRGAGAVAVADRHDRRADAARPQLGSAADRRGRLDPNHDLELSLGTSLRKGGHDMAQN